MTSAQSQNEIQKINMVNINNDSVKDDVNTVTELNKENEQHHDTESPVYKLDEQLD